MPLKTTIPLLARRFLLALVERLLLRSHRAERAEQRLSLAQDETGVGLFELDYSAGTAYVSPALCQILGQPVAHDGTMPLQQWLAALDGGHVEDSRRTLQRKIAAGELRYERELRIAQPDGSVHWLLSRIRLDLDERGELRASRGATLDITARKQLLTELEATQAQLQRQVEDLGRLHNLSNRLLAMPLLEDALRATLEAAASFHDTPFGLLLLCNKDGRVRLAAHCGLGRDTLNELAALETLALGSGQRQVVEDLATDPRFSALAPLLATLGIRALHSTPLMTAGSAQVLGVLTLLITRPGPPDERQQRLTDLCAAQAAALVEREQAQALAREERRRFEVALQSSAVAFTILAPVRDGVDRIVDFAWAYANPAAAALIECPADELIGHRVLEVLPHAWDEPGFFERYVRVSEHGTTDEFETLSGRRTPPRWLHVILSPLNDSVVVWFADVSQRRVEQQALRDADRRKDDFLATLAHELRNPLAPIRHAAAIVRDPAADAVQRSTSLAVIERQLQHMALLLDDLLDVSRITQGTLPLRRVRAPLQPIIDTAVETARPLLDARSHRLHLHLSPVAMWLDADPLRIAQVLGNLLVNAAKYTPTGGEVTLRVHGEADVVVIAVSDTGQGLRAEDCERVFDMFTRLPDANDTVTNGLGIGLALARSLVQLHGGRLDARSPGLGLGSTFTLRLPAAAPADTDGVADSRKEPPERVDRSPRRVLVADDNRDAADILATLLELEGHDVRIAYDGRQALALYEDFRPQVALLDMGMPGHTGTEIAALIRQRHADDRVTLIALTGFGQQGDRQEALAAGFDHHLVKPASVESMRQLIGQADVSAR